MTLTQCSWRKTQRTSLGKEKCVVRDVCQLESSSFVLKDLKELFEIHKLVLGAPRLKKCLL